MYEYDPLFALGAQLGADGLTINYAADGIFVMDDTVPGATDKITCRARPDDGGRMWFWTGRGKPIAEADPDHLADAVLEVQAHLNRCTGKATGAER
ncbi:hypothetical protein ABZ801_18010 [Actinomadura sp. NPDC047616]|uniref:hypothetical protein n=1 Tax=Actinomadura sp. NPDC047616 TaxID=3155914 RepID=UPI00340617DD